MKLGASLLHQLSRAERKYLALPTKTRFQGETIEGGRMRIAEIFDFGRSGYDHGDRGRDGYGRKGY
ncbi:MAG: hypothetical protein ACRDSF_07220, partial [Pseudonocardiaceae bacterium]